MSVREVWLPIPKRAGYEVSNHGRVRNKAGRVLKPGVSGKGYQRVVFGSSRQRPVPGEYVHRLVLMAFVGYPLPGQEANHKDGVKNNNVLWNLEWVTKSENQLHRCHVLMIAVGENHPHAKLTEKSVRAIRELRARPNGIRPTLKQLADLLGVSFQAVDLAARGLTWQHA